MDRSLSLDKVLLEKGFITPEQLTEAIQYQCRLPASQAMSLADVLISMEYVTERQIQEALGQEPPPEDVLVQMLVKEGMIKEEELAEALKARHGENADKRTGTMLLELGYTTREMIESALTQYYLKQHTEAANVHNPVHPPGQSPMPPAPPTEAPPNLAAAFGAQAAPPEPEHVPMGQKLVRKGYISPDELQDALDYQQRLPRILHKPIGEILVTLGYLSEEDLEDVLNERQETPKELSLGEVLVRSGLIQEWQLSHAMSLIEQPPHQGKKLGVLLVELGYARRPDIEKTLKSYYARQR